jgi:hypothetical protein
VGVKCFLLVPTGTLDRRLRRYSAAGGTVAAGMVCSGTRAYHNAETFIDVVPDSMAGSVHDFPSDDPRWPKTCAHCNYAFFDDDHWQLFNEHLWRRADGEPGEWRLRDVPPGAMWDATWMHEDGPNNWCGPDGRALVVKLPNGHDWLIDGQANNCDSPCANCGKPYSAHVAGGIECKSWHDARPHKCWVRHGEPPLLTVDKNGDTCGAGAGSIQAGDWHGFLRNGELVIA